MVSVESLSSMSSGISLFGQFGRCRNDLDHRRVKHKGNLPGRGRQNLTESFGELRVIDGHIPVIPLPRMG